MRRKLARKILKYIDEKFYLYLKDDLYKKDYDKIIREIEVIIYRHIKKTGLRNQL